MFIIIHNLQTRSALSEDMYQDGYENIFNVDYSEPVIEKMQRRCGHRFPRMSCTFLFFTLQNNSKYN